LRPQLLLVERLGQFPGLAPVDFGEAGMQHRRLLGLIARRFGEPRLPLVQFANDNSSNGLDNFSVSAAAGAVAEPSTWVLSLLGFVGLGLLARTGRRARSRPA
jgi:hypothetical protein